jgi:putative ABC transport system permease protein
MVKAKPEVSNKQLIDELTGIMRAARRLKPKADDNFAMNQTSMLTNTFAKLFDVLSIAGGIIGFFSILVGGFSIANIMFVSVKERTPLIGIQKSLGAKNSFILFQFLSEAIFLCLFGGGVGLFVIFLGTVGVNSATEFAVSLTLENVFWGLFISVSIGVISGIVPAIFASRLDPVEAIRSN